jgi:hypothetical protein
VNKDRAITKKIVQHAEKRGIKGLFITVDAPQLGRREKDMRQKFDDQGSEVQRGSAGIDRSQGAARAISVSSGWVARLGCPDLWNCTSPLLILDCRGGTSTGSRVLPKVRVLFGFFWQQGIDTRSTTSAHYPQGGSVLGGRSARC